MLNASIVMKQSKIENRYSFKTNYIDDYDHFKEKILEKSIIPYQVEFQPPPRSKKKICWLECPYCYGLSAEDNGDRMTELRSLEILKQIASRGVNKVIFAGYATDPLNCSYIDELLECAINHNMIFGFNTKALNVNQKMISLLSRNDIRSDSYMSISVDAGSDMVYNKFHDVKSNAKLYKRVLRNVAKISTAMSKSDSKIDLSAAYLINNLNIFTQEIYNFINDFKSAGCNVLRFTFPQLPRGLSPDSSIIPNKDDCLKYKEIILNAVSKYSDKNCRILLVDADDEHDIFRKPRTLPCFARFVFPTVGFDGWLYHCSQSSSPNFRSMALGNLNKKDFWDAYYDYDTNNMAKNFKNSSVQMNRNNCKCDRKMHVMNTSVSAKIVF